MSIMMHPIDIAYYLVTVCADRGAIALFSGYSILHHDTEFTLSDEAFAGS